MGRADSAIVSLCAHSHGVAKNDRRPLGKMGPGGEGQPGPVPGPRVVKNRGRGPSRGSTGHWRADGPAGAPGPASQAWCGPGWSFPLGSCLRLLACEMDMVILASQACDEGLIDESVVRGQVPTSCVLENSEKGALNCIPNPASSLPHSHCPPSRLLCPFQGDGSSLPRASGLQPCPCSLPRMQHPEIFLPHKRTPALFTTFLRLPWPRVRSLELLPVPLASLAPRRGGQLE